MHAFRHSTSFQDLPISILKFGQMIRYRRMEIGISTKRAAVLSGVTRTEWQSIEDGIVPVRDCGLLRSIAGALEIKYETLFTIISTLEHHFEESD